jgi:cytochrome c oxidase assembly protein subunit 11
VTARDPAQVARRNLRVALAPIALACGMLGLSFAASPLYDLFCRVTGFGGTTQVASAAPQMLGARRFTIRFDANVIEVPWRFSPEASSVTVIAGETREIRYKIESVGDRPTTGIANYNVTPELAGAYFNKLACFCFTNQTLGLKEAREETVVFFIDPAIETDPNLVGLDTITLSYTFFPSRNGPKPLANAALPQASQTR